MAENMSAPNQEQEINPWSVEGARDENGEIASIDYEAISPGKWNTPIIDQKLLERFEKVTGHKPHRWLRRGLFFSHRDFDRILNLYERGEPFFLYTGHGPSTGSLHLGHTIPLQFTKWLQDIFDVTLVFMLTEDALGNARDVIAIDIDMKKAFIYSDLKYFGNHFLMNAWEFSKLVTFNQVRATQIGTNTGRVFFPSVQRVAAFATSYPEIWSDYPQPTRIDQDPYFRLLWDNAYKVRFPSPKPALIHSKFLTALQGPGGKMSSSNPNSAIFIGGQVSVVDHRSLGGNPDVDVSYIYLTVALLTGELKNMAIDALQEYVQQFQEEKLATDEILEEYMRPRKLLWEGNPNPVAKPSGF
ncbi:uncharacterized protein BDW43DRAFT_301421 [Aspergillus alliaceus]|uniref:uncharacterized protein n=1 Tax=Petromyces alliaceus TaxID=209559 RepID=UPI0012A75A25|nr:uncharacterized protein BDW43DRAFT_301421 [Aspergillus alliaceus]KAB8231982.1 hypothetical protein BDW43DRAFT_301421 [Aspergillus alliaceus]